MSLTNFPPLALNLTPSVRVYEQTEIGHEFGVANHLICRGNNLIARYNDYLRIRNDKLELIIYECKTPILMPVNIFELYMNVIKQQTPEATTKFLESVNMLQYDYLDAKENYGIVPITPENLAPFIENGILKPFCCIFEA
jgi:hypothetical protein